MNLSNTESTFCPPPYQIHAGKRHESHAVNERGCLGWLRNQRVRLSCLALAAFMQGAHAQASPRVADVVFDDPSWRYSAVVDKAGGTVKVLAVVLVPQPGKLIGDNLSSVVYQPDPSSSDGWSAKAFESASISDVYKSLMGEFQIAQEDAAVWLKETGVSSFASAKTKSTRAYKKGLLVDDILYQAIANDPNVDGIITFLDEVGYKAADVVIDKATTTCSRSTKLNTLALAVERFETRVKSSTTEWAQAVGEAQEMTFGCFAQTTPPGGVPPAPAPTTCTPGWGPWVAGAPVGPRTPLSPWTLESSSITPVTGGWMMSCTYKQCAVFTTMRSTTWIFANCAVGRPCVQILVEEWCSTYTCPAVGVTTGGAAPPTCPAVMFCFPPSPGPALAPVRVISPWGPPCI